MVLIIISVPPAVCGAQGNQRDYSSVEYVIRLGHSDTEDNLINVSLQNYADWVK